MAKNRILNSEEWTKKKNSLSEEWLLLKEKRHNNIVRFNEFKNIGDNFDIAFKNAQNKVSNIINIPKMETENIRSQYYFDELNLGVFNSKDSDKAIALKNAQDAIILAERNQIRNSTYEYSNNIINGINNAYSSAIINPYEAQILFETTSLGYQGVMIPIDDAFSTKIGASSKLLGFYDQNNIMNYLIKKNVLSTIRTAIIDSQVYGGGIITPVLRVNGQPQLLGDLNGDLLKYFGKECLSLDSLMCFDRYCVVPILKNDGLYSMRLLSSMPMNLSTIFEEGDLNYGWYAGFSTDAESRSKLLRPDGFGVSVFARANKAVYNYEQQIQFLNYALGQLSIIVFNSKSQNYMDGGSADHTWDSPLGGKQLNDIRSQLSAMQQSMNIERGLYLNDIEVTALNRTFTGIDSIINAMNTQASLAFGIKQDILFGEVKSSMGYKDENKTTPMMTRLREKFRAPITQVLKWCVLCYYAENNWERIDSNGKRQRWNKEEFATMIDSIEVLYADTIKTNEDILKEYGVSHITKLVESRLIRISSAISYLSEIPILNKSYDIESKQFKEWVEEVNDLQNVGIKADKVEQKAITAINEAILEKKNPLSPSKNLNNLEINEKNVYNKENDASKRPLEDFGELDEFGIIQPRSVEKRKTAKEVTQKITKRRSHE